MLVRIVPIGKIPENLLAELCGELEEIFKARYKISKPMQVSEGMFNFWRKQYDAEKIIETLKKNTKFIDESMPTLGVMEEDIFYNGLNFVFGVEDSKGFSLISLARLRPEFYKQRANITLLTDRMIKEAVHEIGHHLGLEHCSHPFCVMCFSPSVEDVDKKQKYFCNGCKIKLAMKGINID